MDDDEILTSEEEDVYLVGSSSSRIQHIVVIIVGAISCCLSIFGSASILLMSQKKLWDKNPYHRLLFGLSVADIIFSMTCIIQPWMLPHKIMSPSVLTSSFGNETTCSVTGLFAFLSTTTAATYNGLLSVYFVLVVVFNQRSEMIVRRFERLAHVLAWGVPWLLHLPLIITGSFNPDEFMLLCIPMGYPPRCEKDNSCIRGDKAAQLRGLFVVYVLIATIVGIGGTSWVYMSFRRQVRSTSTHNEFSSLTTVRRKTLNRVKTRSILYSMVYINSFAWFVAVEILKGHTNLATTQPDLMYILKLMMYLFYPLQGFLNMMVYVYPLISARRQTMAPPKPSYVATFFTLLQESVRDTLMNPHSTASTSIENDG